MLLVSMKLYYPTNLYVPSHRSELFPLLKPFIKGPEFNDAQRLSIYGVSDKDFAFVEDMKDADVTILPMSWNYYSKTEILEPVYNFVNEARQAGKLVWSINTGDFGVKINAFKNLVVFRQSGYVSNNQSGHVGIPSVIRDILKERKLESSMTDSIYTIKPVVGFCGQANGALDSAFKEVVKQYLRNFKTRIGWSHLEPQTIMSTTYLRASLLRKLDAHPAIATQFIKRKQYRAGVTENKGNHQTTIEFYDNILTSQYVLCVRGAGNFSVRFYETLMMGRIPLYVHTDGYLPLVDEIDWKEHVVWVDYDQRHRIAEILLEFHEQLDQNKLIRLFEKNRKLWKEKLTLSGFFKIQKPR